MINSITFYIPITIKTVNLTFVNKNEPHLIPRYTSFLCNIKHRLYNISKLILSVIFILFEDKGHSYKMNIDISTWTFTYSNRELRFFFLIPIHWISIIRENIIQPQKQ